MTPRLLSVRQAARSVKAVVIDVLALWYPPLAIFALQAHSVVPVGDES